MSGKVNVGFVDGRISSRILKPPGGGYSEIFFTQDDDTASPKKAPPARRQTSIESILCTENTKIEKKVQQLKIEESAEVVTSTASNNSEVTAEESASEESKSEESKSEEVASIEQNGNGVEVKHEKAEEKKHIEEKPVAVKKARVPPGGYTTALW